MSNRPFGPIGRKLVEASRSSFFERKPARTVDCVIDLVDEVAPRLDAWATRFPLVRRERVGPLTLSVAAAAPFSTPQAIESTARVSLWVFALDDVMDEALLSEPDSAQFVSNCVAVLGGDASVYADGSLVSALVEVRDDLRGYDLFKQFGFIWSDAVRSTIREMERENVWRAAYLADGAGALPSFDEYVACGRYSIGGPPHIWAEVLTLGDRSACDAIDHLLRMEECASVCVRLANDLQSEAKEVGEGTVNSLVIAARDIRAAGIAGPDIASMARGSVLGRVASGLLALDAMQAESATATGHSEAAIADIARFVCEFYRDFDYHTFSTPLEGRS